MPAMKLQRQNRWPGLLLTGVAHLAVLYFFLQSQRLADPPRAPRDAIQWLLPLPKGAAPRVAAPAPRVKTPPAAPRQSSPIAEPAPAAPIAPSASEPAPAPAPYDPFAQTQAAPPSGTDGMLAQAKLDAGRIDKELRKIFPIAEPLPPPDSKQARLQRGFDAAHEAVPPKWYQGARMVELSTPDGENKTRTYKITTALLTYCINIYSDGRKSYTECPR
jgi:hypothetical protein